MQRPALVGCVAAVVVVALSILSRSAPAQSKVALTESNSPWSAIPFDARDTISVVLSEDAKRGAYVTTVQDRFRVILDGQPIDGDHDAVAADSLVFSGARFAYAARRETRWMVFADHVPGDPYDAIVGSSLCFSPGGTRLAYVAVADKKTYVVVDGHRDAPCDAVEGNRVTFSPSGERLAYIAKRNGRHGLVVDGKDGPQFDEVGRPAFSADGAHVAYAARNGVRWSVTRDGQQLALASAAVQPGTLAISDDGTRVVYAVRSTGTGMRLADGDRLGEPHEWVFDGSAKFSPDGKRLAYVVREDGKCAVVVDGTRGPLFDGVVPTSVTFRGDGKRIAYVAEVVHDKKVRRRVVVDEKAQAEFADVRGVPQFAPNGVNVAYIAELDDRRQCVVVDGTAGKPYRFMRGPLSFSPDGQAVGVLALGDDGRFELGEELPADPVQDRRGRLVLDRSQDLKNVMRQKPFRRMTSKEDAWQLRPLDIRLVHERITYD